MKKIKRGWLSNSLKFILLLLIVIIIWLLIAAFTGIKLTTIVFGSIILAMGMSIVVNIVDLDKNLKDDPQQLTHIAARYKFKGLWYLIATIATIALMIDESRGASSGGSLILNSILVFIVFYECIDNNKSYFVEKKKLKNVDRIGRLEDDLSALQKEVDSLKSNNHSEENQSVIKTSTVGQKSFLIIVIVIIGIIKKRVKK